MQTIQLQATPAHDYRFPETVELHMAAPLPADESNLDDALAVVLNAVRQSKNPNAMDALGTLLAYMESLEKKQRTGNPAEAWVTLANPITMSF
jgi:alkylhydroperoxidase/carboxymuconolactone decarboxylase family protein YurZ